MTAVGVVGVGRMGGAMAGHLVKAGFDVTVCDVDPAAVEHLVRAGARPAGSPRELATHSDVVVMVVDDDQTKEVVSGPNGLLDGARAGTVCILCSSLQPDTVRHLQAQAAPRQCTVIDAPVTGGERGARDGTLTFLVGADDHTYRRVRPVLEAMGREIELVGPAGSGQVLKMVHNMILWAQLAATGEALQLASREGIGVETVQRAMAHCPANNQQLQQWEQVYTTWAEKDLSAATALAAQIGLSVPLSDFLHELLKGWRKPNLPA